MKVSPRSCSLHLLVGALCSSCLTFHVPLQSYGRKGPLTCLLQQLPHQQKQSTGTRTFSLELATGVPTDLKANSWEPFRRRLFTNNFSHEMHPKKHRDGKSPPRQILGWSIPRRLSQPARNRIIVTRPAPSVSAPAPAPAPFLWACLGRSTRDDELQSKQGVYQRF